MQSNWRLFLAAAVSGLVLVGCNKPQAAGPNAGKWGYIDKKTGNFIIQPQFDDASNFSADGAIVRNEKRLLRLQSDPPGESQTPVKPDDKAELPPMSTLHAADGEGDTYKVMDGDKVVFDVKTKPASDEVFHGNDYVCVQFGKKFGFIDKKGHLAFGTPFSGARDYSEGRAAVQDGGKWGFINKKGTFVIKPQYLDAGSFVEGLAPVKVPAEPKAQ